jgi:hypothetical protein
MTDTIRTSTELARWTDAQSDHDDGCHCVHAAQDAGDAPIAQEPSIAALAEMIARRA